MTPLFVQEESFRNSYFGQAALPGFFFFGFFFSFFMSLFPIGTTLLSLLPIIQDFSRHHARGACQLYFVHSLLSIASSLLFL